jgi:hypothetical protein
MPTALASAGAAKLRGTKANMARGIQDRGAIFGIVVLVWGESTVDVQKNECRCEGSDRVRCCVL